MNSDLSQSIDDIKGLAKLFRAVITLSEQVESVEALSLHESSKKNSIAELDAVWGAKKTALTLFQEEHEATLSKVEEAKEAAAKTQEDAIASAAGILEKAYADSEVIINEAHKKAEVVDAELLEKQALLNKLTLETHEAHNLYNEAAARLQEKRDEIRAIAG